MPTFYLSAVQLAALSAFTVAGSKDKVTPVLTATQLHVTPTTVTALATDRYIAAELTFPLGDTVHTLSAEGSTLLIPNTTLVDLAKLKIGMMLTWEDDAEGAHIVHVNTDSIEIGSRTFLTMAGNFPPVGRLFPDETPDDLPGGILLNMAHVARLSKLTLPGEKLGDAAQAPWALTYDAPKEYTTKHRPILASRQWGDRTETALRVLIQPSMRVASRY